MGFGGRVQCPLSLKTEIKVKRKELGLFFNAWYWAWTLFMTIPVYYSLAGAIKRRKFSEFAYPIFVAFVYCLFGMLFKIWHPGWVIFLTIPIYSPIAEAIDRRNAKSKKSS